MVLIIVCIIAGLGAGIGTGLAGLSAAVVITPMLITFCGFTAYEAVGIALASDVLASAVTAYTYGKNKNLDIKNGLIMMASVLVFTILGSWLSSLLPNAVLGGSSYVMTFIMGVRFLVSPITKITSRMDEIEPKKRIIRSLLSGIHIGLFCGFVGAGGGVLLLITLTSVLGYSLKTAVGTSTFIMTFTALTGAVSHVIIGGTVNVTALVVCVIAALVGARASALFANKVDAKKQNRVTGVALCGLGAVLALVNWL